MYALLTYPLDVIKTNRILQTSLSKEGQESIPRELVALYERGGFQRGAFRGFLMGVIAAFAYQPMTENYLRTGFLGSLGATALINPWYNL